MPVTLQRTVPPAGAAALASLRATYGGAGGAGEVTILDFYDAGAAETAVGAEEPNVPDLSVWRRLNVVLLYRRSAGPDRGPALRGALRSAPMAGG